MLKQCKSFYCGLNRASPDNPAERLLSEHHSILYLAELNQPLFAC